MRKYIFIFLSIFSCFTACRFPPKEQKEDKTFYNTITDWNVKYVPIIEPYRLRSIDQNVWSLDHPDEIKIRLREDREKNSSQIGTFQISSFGVSQNYIYGQCTISGDTHDTWFLFNTNNMLFVEYATGAELFWALEKHKLDKNPINTSESYYLQLKNGEGCYWFPPKGESYPAYPTYRPDSCTVIKIDDNENRTDFKIIGKVRKDPGKIYYFKVEYNNENNELLYLSINHSSPKLVVNNEIHQVYGQNDSIDIAVYTPYPVAQKKGISEEDRIVISKAIPIIAKK